jgi:hypothetical protein
MRYARTKEHNVKNLKKLMEAHAGFSAALESIKGSGEEELETLAREGQEIAGHRIQWALCYTPTAPEAAEARLLVAKNRIEELEAEYDRRSDRGLDTFETSEELAKLRAEVYQTDVAA